MCTLTISRDRQSVCVTMNRDERRDRTESGLVSRVSSESRIYFPEDKPSGGTWIGLNDSGVILCLMNRYDCPADSDKASRGEIIPAALSCGDFVTMVNWLNNHFDYSRYNPFTLVLVTSELTLRIDWSGQYFTQEEVSIDDIFMATSSSVDTQRVIRYRQKQFVEWQRSRGADLKGIPGFHLQQDNDDTSSSVFMARDTTHTKSITQVKMSDSEAKITYFDNQQIQSCYQATIENKEISVFPTVESIQLKSMQLRMA
ncbi:NRDE family protein [Aurantivibrio infirmus]